MSEPSATLTHRGESFEMRDGERLYEGECLWSWEAGPDGASRPTHPLELLASSIRCSVGGQRIALDAAGQRAAAALTRRLLEARSGADSVVIGP